MPDEEGMNGSCSQSSPTSSSASVAGDLSSSFKSLRVSIDNACDCSSSRCSGDPDEIFSLVGDSEKSPTELKELVSKTYDAMHRNGRSPALCEEGTGETYFMYDSAGQITGVFKANDEESFTPNNPTDFGPSSPSSSFGISPGEASVREVAAYLLDHGHFAGVPQTDFVMCRHSFFEKGSPSQDAGIQQAAICPPLSPSNRSVRHFLPQKSPLKVGSFQEFIPNDGDSEEIPRSLLHQFPVKEVHKIAVLDLRLFNTDRNGGNVLYKEVIDPNTHQPSVVLTPIDHGFTIPASLSDAWFEWLYWPQACEKFDHQTLQYIRSLDVEKDIALLKHDYPDIFREEHFLNLRISYMLLQVGASEHLTPNQIARIMCRTKVGRPSLLEHAVEKAKEQEGSPFLDSLRDQLHCIIHFPPFSPLDDPHLDDDDSQFECEL